MNEREQRARELAASMPNTSADLLDVAASAVNALHLAIMAGDQEKAELAAYRYEGTIWKFNGGTFYGCVADEDASGNLVENYCRATPGSVPRWGQSGEFLIMVDGIRALVDFSNNMGALRAHFAFQIVDLDKPFISETGYRSHFDEMHAGQTVDVAATVIFAAYISEKRHHADPGCWDRLAREPLPVWLTKTSPLPCQPPAALPSGFMLVDVVLPAQRAFIVRKWAEQARKRIEDKIRRDTGAMQDE